MTGFYIMATLAFNEKGSTSFKNFENPALINHILTINFKSPFNRKNSITLI